MLKEVQMKYYNPIKVKDNCYPVGNIFGIDIYEVIHTRTNHKIYVKTLKS